MRRYVLLCMFTFIGSIVQCTAQGEIDSKVYPYPEIGNPEILVRNSIFEGSDPSFSSLTMVIYSLPKGGVFTQETDREERIFILKKGQVELMIPNQSATVEAGSVALVMPYDRMQVTNLGMEAAEFYLFSYVSKSDSEASSRLKSRGSQLFDWDKIPFNTHDRGGVRNFYDRGTVMGERMEMHVTTLNVGIKSHEPHTHKASEIVLMVEGKSEMQIGDQFFQGKAGDLYYLNSMIPHAIRNTDSKPITYFAFQFE